MAYITIKFTVKGVAGLYSETLFTTTDYLYHHVEKKYMPSKVWDEITCPFPKFISWEVFSSHILIDVIIHQR